MKTYGRKSRVRQKYDNSLNFDLICRLCLSEDGEMQDLFQENDNNSPPILLQIMGSVSLAIFENDGLPTQICQDCQESITRYYQFKQKCEDSDSQLRKALKTMTEKEPPETLSQEELLDVLTGSSDPVETDVREVIDENVSWIKRETPLKKQSMNNLLQVVSEKRARNLDNAEITQTESGSYIVEVGEMEDEDYKIEDTLQCRIVIDMPNEDNQDPEEILGVPSSTRGDEEFVVQHEMDGEEEDCDMETQDEEYLEEEFEDGEEDGTEHIMIKEDLESGVRHIIIRKRPIKTEEGFDYVISEVSVDELQDEEEHRQMKREEEMQYREHVGRGNEHLIKAFECIHCPKKFVKRIDLRRHLSVHQDKKALGMSKGFDCEVCDKWFPNQTTLRRHDRSHTGERPFGCVHCGKRFSQAGILQRHIMTHTGLKPYTCDVCQKGFTQREGLKIHLKTHGPKNPEEIMLHECPLCEKSFCHPSGLSRHLLVHTGKTFDCEMCPKVFTDPSSLRRHIKRHLVIN